MPPVYFLGDRLNGLEASIVSQEDGTTAVEVTAAGTTSVAFAEPSIEQLLLLILLEQRRMTLGLSILAGHDLTQVNDPDL